MSNFCKFWLISLLLNNIDFSSEDLINSVRGLQQFAAARAGGSFLGTGDARQEEASLDLLVPNSSQVTISKELNFGLMD